MTTERERIYDAIYGRPPMGQPAIQIFLTGSGWAANVPADFPQYTHSAVRQAVDQLNAALTSIG